jgi:hypothetical protein
MKRRATRILAVQRIDRPECSPTYKAQVVLEDYTTASITAVAPDFSRITEAGGQLHQLRRIGEHVDLGWDDLHDEWLVRRQNPQPGQNVFHQGLGVEATITAILHDERATPLIDIRLDEKTAAGLRCGRSTLPTGGDNIMAVRPRDLWPDTQDPKDHGAACAKEKLLSLLIQHPGARVLTNPKTSATGELEDLKDAIYWEEHDTIEQVFGR